jgi:hypothetical protein
LILCFVTIFRIVVFLFVNIYLSPIFNQYFLIFFIFLIVFNLNCLLLVTWRLFLILFDSFLLYNDKNIIRLWLNSIFYFFFFNIFWTDFFSGIYKVNILSYQTISLSILFSTFKILQDKLLFLIFIIRFLNLFSWRFFLLLIW